jgi:uncharacterized protein YkwD
MKLLILMLIAVSQFKAQNKKSDEISQQIYDEIINRYIENYLKTNPVKVDLEEQKCDSIFLGLINEYRTNHHLTTLKFIDILDSACRLHTMWMLIRDTISHTETSLNIDGKFYYNPIDRIRRYDQNWPKNHPEFYENCAISYGRAGNDPTIQFERITAESIVKVFKIWQNSPGHNAAMLLPDAKYIGYYIGSKYKKRQNFYFQMATMLISK